MYFTREPIVESVITPASGHKLVVKPSNHNSTFEYRVEAVEIVSFPGGLFYRNIEGTKTFLVPAKDYEVVEVRESRLSLKLSSPVKEESTSPNRPEPQTPSKRKKRSRNSKRKEKGDQVVNGDEVADSEQSQISFASEDSQEIARDSTSTIDSADHPVQDFPVDAQKAAKEDVSRNIAEANTDFQSSAQVQENSSSVAEAVSEDESSTTQESTNEKPKARRTRRTQRRPRTPRKGTNAKSSDEENETTDPHQDPAKPLPNLLIPPPGLVSDLMTYETIANDAVKQVGAGSTPLQVSLSSEKQVKKTSPATHVQTSLEDVSYHPIIEFTTED